ncbi:MAG: hypothetical protein L3J93_02630 [Thermoplasmata archaeon]|nr:hypothetical protein [Thermoplasmata archaeon]
MSSTEFVAVFVQVLIVLVILRRSIAMTRGVPYSTVRLVVLPVLILLIWVVDELESFYLSPFALPYLVGLDLAILVGTSLAFVSIAERMTEVARDPSGGWTFRIGFSLAALFVGLFVVRLLLAILLVPSALEFGKPAGGSPSVGQQALLVLIDGLFSMSAGLLIARSSGIRRKWRSVRDRAPAVPST